MNEKLNIAEILKHCPKGMELDCTMYDSVQLKAVMIGNIYPIKIQTPEGIISLTKNGCYSINPHCKCVIFPKGKTTWEGFQRPFKHGDILSNGICICIYNGNENDKYYGFYVGVGHIDYPNYFIKTPENSYFTKENTHIATEEEKEKLFKAIKDNGYKWRAETKTLEKLIKPKFKVGDRIVKRNSISNPWIVSSVSSEYYGLTLPKGSESIGVLLVSEQGDWELVPDKFDITTLKPFDKVLVRDSNILSWINSFYSNYDVKDDYPFHCIDLGKFKQCIPYESNEHLLGTTNDCDKYFKTWE